MKTPSTFLTALLILVSTAVFACGDGCGGCEDKDFLVFTVDGRLLCNAAEISEHAALCCRCGCKKEEPKPVPEPEPKALCGGSGSGEDR